MNTPSPQGPTIPASTNFLNNFTRLLKVTDSVKGISFNSPNPDTPNIDTVLSGGTLSNLNDPVLDSQGATYAYLQAHGGSGNPGGITGNVQYNNGGVFGGSNSLTFDKNTNTLTANIISNGTITIGSNTISGLSNPTNGTEAATKSYVDSAGSLTIVNINTVGPTTYTATDIINHIIYRDTQTSGTTTDTFPTAAQIVTESDASVGTTIYFGIRNVNADYTNIVNFNVGSGITFGNTQNIFAGYQYNGVIIVTNVTPGSEAATVYSLGCTETNTLNWGVELNGLGSKVDTVRITDYFPIFNTPTSIYSSSPISINQTSVNKKILYISDTVARTVNLDSPYSFMGVVKSSSTITNPYIWTSGGIDFYIVNQSSTSGANVTLTGTGILPWTMDPNSNMKIPPGYTGWFMIYLTVTDYPDVASLTSANAYCLGIMPNA